MKNDDASVNNLRIWTVIMEGASNTLYEGEKFLLQFRFDEQYPFSSPEVNFLIKFKKITIIFFYSFWLNILYFL